jgi:hypothetical protein
MVRWICEQCSVKVDTADKTVPEQCYQGFACGETGEASQEVLKLGNLCCNCARHAGISQMCMIRSLTEHWNTSDFTKNDYHCR